MIMMKTKKAFSLAQLLLLILVLISLVGCSGVQTQPTKTFDQLSPDEQARVVLSAVQYGSDPLFDIGKSVFVVKPEYMAAWKLGVVPSFDQVNKILLDLETRGSQGQQITGDVILQSVQGRIAEIISTVTQYGTIRKTSGAKPTSEDYGLVAVLGIPTAVVVWNDIVAAMAGHIPSWEIILARNKALQAKIDAEK
jgi:hypothetical protein